MMIEPDERIKFLVDYPALPEMATITVSSNSKGSATLNGQDFGKPAQAVRQDLSERFFTTTVTKENPPSLFRMTGYLGNCQEVWEQVSSAKTTAKGGTARGW
jgi:hypothetical protein